MKESAIKLGLLTSEQFDENVKPEKMLGNIFIYSIETYSSHRLGDFPTAWSNVFMICMTVHWKDNPNH